MIAALYVAAAMAVAAPLPCVSAACPALRAFETVACTAGVCTASAPPAADFAVDAGLSIDLGSAAGYTLTVCAEPGQTLVGSGSMDVYVVNPWTPTLVTRDASLDFAVADVTSTTACGGAACRCVTWPDQQAALPLQRRIRVIANGVTVSSGNLTVYLFGALRSAR